MVTEKDVLDIMEAGGKYLGLPIYGVVSVGNAEKIVTDSIDFKIDKVYFNNEAVRVIRPNSNGFLRFIPLGEISRNDLAYDLTGKDNSFYSIFFRKKFSN